MRSVFQVIVVVAAAAVLAEVGVRVVDRLRGRPYDAERTRATVDEICRSLAPRVEAEEATQVPGKRLLQPYVAWQDADMEERFADDAAYYATPAAQAAFDVLVLGGAEAARLGREGAAALAAALRGDPRVGDREVRVHAYALEGFKQPQGLMALAMLLSLGHEPDLVIELDGRDDALLGWSNAKEGTHPLHPSIAHWASASNGMRSDWELVERLYAAQVSRERARAFGERLLAPGVLESAVLAHAGGRRLARLRADAVAAEARVAEYLAQRPKEAELGGPRYAKDDASVAATIADAWAEASIEMHALCAARAIDFVHVLEPEPAGSAGAAPVYARMRDAVPRIRARGVLFLDTSGRETVDSAAIAGAWSSGRR
jgi:hypothetical protein